MEFNDAVRYNTSFKSMNDIIDKIRENLPKSKFEIEAAFNFMIDEGLVMNISMIVQKLSKDLANPLLVRK